MIITLFVTAGCSVCERESEKIRAYSKGRTGMKLKITDNPDEASQPPMIFPALFVGEELFSYGDIDLGKLEKYLGKENKNKGIF